MFNKLMDWLLIVLYFYFYYPRKDYIKLIVFIKNILGRNVLLYSWTSVKGHFINGSNITGG